MNRYIVRTQCLKCGQVAYTKRNGTLVLHKKDCPYETGEYLREEEDKRTS